MIYINPDPPHIVRQQIRKRIRAGFYMDGRTALAAYRHALCYWYESQS